VSLSLPLVCFHREYSLLVRDWDELTITTSYALKHGKFARLLLVDSKGMAARVRSARKLHSVGPFRGFNIFLNQRIKIELCYEGNLFPISLTELREMLLESFEKWHGWSSAENFEELRAKVTRATTFGELFDALFSS
jgi:hypothetical protein